MSQEKVKSLLDKINLLFNVFMKDGLEKISELEKDLLKEQINKLVTELDNIKFETKTVIETPKEIVRPSTPVIEEVKQEVKPKEKEEVKQEVKPVEVVKEMPMQKDSLPTAEELMPEVKKPQEVPAKPVVETPKEEERVFSNNKPLRNLKEVIDLNKSFIFKAELFDNNQDEYNAFINALNNLQTERESIEYVETIASRKAWDIESKVYELLNRSVEKRFLPLLQQ